MKTLNWISSIGLLCGLAMWPGCTKDISDNRDELPPPINGNRPPVVRAGGDAIVVLPIDTVLLDGSASYDLDGSIVYYKWTVLSGPEGILIDNPNLATTVARNLVEGDYLFELKGKDDKGSISMEQKKVTVTSPYECDISGRARVFATLTEIGSLSAGGAPYSAVCGSKIIFGGGAHGNAGVDIYDTKDQSWTRTQLSVARTNMAVTSCGNKVFFAGGNNRDEWYNVVDIYDVSTGQWSVNYLSEAKSFAGAGAVGDKVFFAGGITDYGWNQTNSIDIYDISEDRWSVATLSESKTGVTVVTAGNKIYFAGGCNYLTGTKTALPGYQAVDVYDYVSDSWSVTRLHEICGEVNGLAVNGQIIWAGWTPSQLGSKVETWNLSSGDYTVNCLSYPRTHPQMVRKSGDILFLPVGGIGAMISNDDITDRFDVYNMNTGQWSVGRLSIPIAGAAVVCVDNVIYVAGGKTANGYEGKLYTLNW